MMTRNVLDWLEETARKRPQAPAFRSQDQMVTYAGLQKRSLEIGSFLAERIPQQQGVHLVVEKAVYLEYAAGQQFAVSEDALFQKLHRVVSCRIR